MELRFKFNVLILKDIIKDADNDALTAYNSFMRHTHIKSFDLVDKFMKMYINNLYFIF